MKKNNRRDAAWRSVLKQGDPLLEDQALSPGELARMRAAMSAAMPSGGQRVKHVAPVWALAVSCMFALLVIWGMSRVEQTVFVPHSVEDQTVEDEPRQRKIEFSTPGGTRVVWTLASDFDV
jgi:hypothetical protein